MALNTWTGAANDGLYMTSGNWSLGHVPTAADSVVIGSSVFRPTVTLNAGQTAETGSLTTYGVLQLMDGVAFHAGAVTVETGGDFLAGSVGSIDIDGKLINSGVFTSYATVVVGSIDNTGGNIFTAGSATYVVTSAAGFGAAGELTGALTLADDALFSFKNGGEITDIVGIALLLEANSTATGALLGGLTTVDGTLFIEDRCSFSTTSSGLTNNGAIIIDRNFGGSSIDINGTLTDNGSVNIGYPYPSYGFAPTNVTLGGLTIDVTGVVSTTFSSTVTVTGALNVVAGGILSNGGKLVVGGGGLIAGMLSNIGELVFSGGVTTIAESLDYLGAFGLASGATITIASGYLDLMNNATISHATVNGARAFVNRGATSVSSLTIGGTVVWADESAVTQSGGAVTLGDGSEAAARMLVTAAALYDIADDSGIERGASTASLATNQGLFEKTGGTGTSTIAVSFTNSGALTAATGTLAFAGPTNNFSGALTGAGAIALTGGLSVLKSGMTETGAHFSISGAGTTVSLRENLSYAGDFTLGAGAHVNVLSGNALTLAGTGSIAGLIGTGALDVAGGITTLEAGGGVYTSSWTISGATTDLAVDEAFDYAGIFDLISGATLTIDHASDIFALRGPTTLANATVGGFGRFATVGDASVSAFTLGGSTLWEDEETVTQADGDVTFADTARILITTGSTYDIADDSDIKTTNIAWFTNQGLFEKTGGAGTSDIAPRVTNDGAIEVASGTLDFQGAVRGTGTDAIAGDATLEFGFSVAPTQTIDFTGAGGTLSIASPDLFAGSISGFDTAGASDTIEVSGPWTYAGFTENAAHTQGALIFAQGGATASLTLLGDHASASFHAMASGGVIHVTYG